MGREERVRPPVPAIPGLHKGKIEAEREIWASRRRVGFSENRADVFVIAKELELYLRLPVLGMPRSESKEGEISSLPLWMPRIYKPTGAIYISSWESIERVDPSAVVAFGGRKYVEGLSLETLPESWTLARLTPRRYETIGDAIKAADKIANYEGLGGPAQQRVEKLFSALNSISEAFLHEEITPLRLEGLSREAENLLREQGLLRARDRIWKRIADRTLRATSKDIKNRINPMISRILARAAYLEAVLLESRQRAAREKALKLSFFLNGIEAESRSRLENAEMALDKLGGFAYFKPPAALSEEREIHPREALPFELALIALGKDLREIEVAPYAQIARLAEAILVGRIGKSNREIEALSQSLSERGKRELATRSAVDYLMAKDAILGRKRMYQGFAVIHQGLEGIGKKE